VHRQNDLVVKPISATADATIKILAHLDRLETVETSVWMEITDQMAREDHPVHQAQCPHGTTHRLQAHALHAHLAPRDQLEPQAKQESQERKAHPAAKETMANQAQLAKQETQAHLDHLELLANPARRDHLVRMRRKARRDQQESQETRQHQDHPVPLERKEAQANKAPLDQQDLVDHLVKEESLERRDQRAKEESLARTVQMPTTAPAQGATPRLLRQRLPKAALDIWRRTRCDPHQLHTAPSVETCNIPYNAKIAYLLVLTSFYWHALFKWSK